MPTTRTIRIRMRGGYLEPLDDLQLPEGSETTAVVVVPDRDSPRGPHRVLKTWNLGLGHRQLTREDSYGDDE